MGKVEERKMSEKISISGRQYGVTNFLAKEFFEVVCVYEMATQTKRSRDGLFVIGEADFIEAGEDVIK